MCLVYTVRKHAPASFVLIFHFLGSQLCLLEVEVAAAVVWWKAEDGRGRMWWKAESAGCGGRRKVVVVVEGGKCWLWWKAESGWSCFKERVLVEDSGSGTKRKAVVVVEGVVVGDGCDGRWWW